MKKFHRNVPTFALTVFACCALGGPSFADAGEPDQSPVVTAGGRIYQGTYAAADKVLAVDIDGVQYRGHYAGYEAKDSPRLASESDVPWGSAFLFASSAKVLQCRLEQGFPKAIGRCQDADGREFRLQAASPP